MPRKRLHRELWDIQRKKVWERDGGRCQSPLEPPICKGKPGIALEACHIDHVRSGKLGGNELANLRVLCPACHALRLDERHRGMIARALRKGLIPPDWRRWAWE